MATVHRMAITPQQADQMIDDSELRDRHTERVHTGWRRGKPVEDPEKTKRWGYITAKPSEYLIHMRRGRILRKTTGQGASCFKWPWDSVAMIPTTINRLQFTADQVTLEKVGVQVTGLAVYRIVEPEITFRMLNFSYAERASEKLADILREMFVGATRRHVANLSVDAVITRRKNTIAQELMSELAPVMRGQGQSEDSTSTGWGVVLDTVEIQDVRILSDEVFRDMQAEFRAQLALRARQAELENAKEIAAREASSARAIEEAKLTADTATRQLRAQAESETTNIELEEEQKRATLRARVRSAELAREQDQRAAELRMAAQLKQQEASQEEAARLAALAREQRVAEAERENIESRHMNQMRQLELDATLTAQHATREAELHEAASQAQEILRRREIELERITGELQAAVQRNQRDIENTVSEDRIRMALVEQSLPAMAQAFAQQFGEVRFTQIGGGDDNNPSAMIARSLAQILEIARGMGVNLGAARKDG